MSGAEVICLSRAPHRHDMSFPVKVPDEKTLSTFPSLLFSPVRRVLEDYRTGGF
jgi:hypothetical protein